MASETNDSYEALMQFLYQIPIGLVQISASGAIEMLNPMAARLLMTVSRDGALDNLFDVLAEVAPHLPQMTSSFALPAGVVCESLRIDLDQASGIAMGEMQLMSLSLLKLDESRFMAMVADATLDAERERQKIVSRLHDAARTDLLTKLPNRAAILEQLQHMLDLVPVNADREFAVLFMNCDRFKQINDTLGHAAGDDVLRQMADRLQTTLRPSERLKVSGIPGQMAARIGSDEFVVVLDSIRRYEDLLAVARRVLEVLSKPYATAYGLVSCSLSMGAIFAAHAADDADALLQDASIAMVEAKRSGGGRNVLFEPAMRERAASRGSVESELRRALAENEFFVVYQPVVGLQTGPFLDRGAAVEALVRWQHPVRGVVPPLAFIGILEECGLISALGEFVLERACRDFMQWHRLLGDGAPKLLAVNLSRGQLTEPGLGRRVQAILQRTGMPAARLQLEVTESLAAQDEAVQAQLHDLKALGLTLALDDFGTGYSSLACLHLLPVDTVKIDRSFVCQADTSAHHRVLIKATVDVAHSLGMSSVAEGIETEAQAAVVRELGCEKGQGYLFSRPLAAADLVNWLQSEVINYLHE